MVADTVLALSHANGCREDEAGSSSNSRGSLDQLQKAKTDTGLTPEQLEEVRNGGSFAAG